MLEVEIKFPVAADRDLPTMLKRVGATSRGDVEQIDLYLAHPCRNFAKTDEALRVRRVGEQNFVTYKGPKLDATTKTRREIELPLTSGTAAAEMFGELLVALGFQPVATVRKTRSVYEVSRRSHPIEIAVDHVDELGTFVEIETAANESGLDSAREAILSLAEELGLEAGAGERRSYLEMLLEGRPHP